MPTRERQTGAPRPSRAVPQIRWQKDPPISGGSKMRSLARIQVLSLAMPRESPEANKSLIPTLETPDLELPIVLVRERPRTPLAFKISPPPQNHPDESNEKSGLGTTRPDSQSAPNLGHFGLCCDVLFQYSGCQPQCKTGGCQWDIFQRSSKLIFAGYHETSRIRDLVRLDKQPSMCYNLPLCLPVHSTSRLLS